jgi:hypothetical protein
MMMKKHILCFPAIVGIVFLLGSCADLLSSPKDHGAIPQGKGRLAVNVENSRTALPSGTFGRYVLRFSYTGADAYTHGEVEWSTGITVDLEPGAWTVYLDAYAGTVISGTGSAVVTVGAGTVTPVTITIGVNADAGATGTLKYKVSYPDADVDHNYGTETLTVHDAAGIAVGGPENITNGAWGTLALNPGIYFVGVVIVDTTQRTGVARTSVAHIYGGRETSLEFNIGRTEFAALVPVAVTADLTVPGGVTVSSRQVSAYKEAGCTSIIGMADVAALTGHAELTLWAPSSSSAVYIRQEIVIGGVTLNGGTETVSIPNPDQAVTASLDDTAYKVSIAPITGGTVAADNSVIFPGNPVTVTVTPEPGSGYTLKSGTLQYSHGGTDYSITGSAFTMPPSDVTVSAVFHKAIGFTIKDIQETTVSLTADPPDYISWSDPIKRTATFYVNDPSYTVEAGNLRWMINGIEITTAAGGYLVIHAQDYLPRIYYVTVMIKENGQWYSKDLMLMVTP